MCISPQSGVRVCNLSVPRCVDVRSVNGESPRREDNTRLHIRIRRHKDLCTSTRQQFQYHNRWPHKKITLSSRSLSIISPSLSDSLYIMCTCISFSLVHVLFSLLFCRLSWMALLSIILCSLICVISLASLSHTYRAFFLSLLPSLQPDRPFILQNKFLSEHIVDREGYFLPYDYYPKKKGVSDCIITCYYSLTHTVTQTIIV